MQDVDVAQRVIFDTDIGTDVDDILALALILGSPEVNLAGVTCVYGDVMLRSRIAMQLLRLRNEADTPVFLGARQPLLGLRPVYWAGHEGKGLLDQGNEELAPASEHAVDFIVRTVMDNPGQIHLIAVGPLTNIAIAFLREPRLAEHLAHLTIMGGVLRGPDNLHLPYVEHNIRCDPEAAHVVLSAGAPTTLVPLDVTMQVRIWTDGVARLRSKGTTYHDAIATQVELYPTFRERGHTFVHDPLAVAAVIRPDLVRLEPVHLDVETEGRHTAGATLMRTPTDTAPTNVAVALGVDVGEFEEFLIERLAR